VECIHDIEVPKSLKKGGGFFSVLASVCPPASYYDPTRTTKSLKDGFTFTSPELANGLSSQKSFRFDEGDAVLKGFVPTQRGMSIVFDVKIYDPEKDTF
jgi:hypothetical protein